MGNADRSKISTDRYTLREVVGLTLAVDVNNEATEILASQHFHLKQRVRRGGVSDISDDQLLELVIQCAIPKCDPRLIVHRLLKAFGDINHVLAASESQLFRIEGMTEAIVERIKVMEITGHRMAQVAVLDRVVFEHWEALMSYLRSSLSHQEIELFRVMYLNKKNALIADEELGRGTVDHVPVYPREIVRRALLLSASGLIVVHNHPSGDPSPSNADVEMTHLIAAAAKTLDLILYDHIIIGKGREFSFRSEGLL